MNVPDTMGNVQTSKNIRLAAGVNFTKINDELKRRANTLADILKNEYGMTLVISSGYRTKAQQAALLRKGTGYMTAQPGRSKHQYGKAFDVAINSHMKPQFYKNKRAMQQYGGNFNAFWADMTRRAGLYRFSPNGDPPHHTLPPGTQYGGSPRRMNNPQYATTVRPGNNISMSPNITVDKGVRWDGLHSYMKELLNYFGDNMMRKYGIKPHFRHMHRTKADQQPHYDAYRSGRGGIAARPGNSFHQAGLAADLDWPRIQAFFNKRADLKKAYNNNFWRFIDDELRQVGLYRSLGMRDRPHIQPIKNDRYYARVNHNALMSSRGTWDMGGAPFELHQPYVRGGRLNIGYMRQPVNTEVRDTNAVFRTSGNRPNAPGMRINNPFNLKHINGLRPGEIPRNKIGEARKHATFDTLASGVNAGVRDIVYHKFIRRGINNISDFVDTYLGAAVKNDPRAKPEQYKSNLERMMGIKRNQHIDVRNEDMMVRFLASVLDNETGSSKYIGTNNLRMAYRKVMSDVLSGRR